MSDASPAHLPVWQAAVAAANRPAALGPVLLQITGEGVAIASDPRVAASLRLATAERRFLQRRYDECLDLLDPREDQQDYAPRLRDYLRAVSLWMTVERDAAAAALAKLPMEEAVLTQTLGAARRFVVELLRREIERGESSPLATVAGRMGDVGRRLALGEADDRVIEQQQRAIEQLDGLIKELEEQQQQMAAQASNAGGSPGGSPAEESRPGELKGPGEVDRKRFAAGDPWGSLTPTEREKLTQDIARDFPGHYRDLIERYFETLADPAAQQMLEAPPPAEAIP